MNGHVLPDVNLASRPMRNRRFFLASGAGLACLAVLTGWLGLGSLVRAKRIQAGAARETARLEAIRTGQDRLRAEREAETVRLKSRLKDKVEIVNQALTMKGFSWVEFFDLLPHVMEAGFDVLNPVQWSAGGRSWREWKDACRGRLALWGGGVNTQRTLPLGTVAEVERETLA